MPNTDLTLFMEAQGGVDDMKNKTSGIEKENLERSYMKSLLSGLTFSDAR